VVGSLLKNPHIQTILPTVFRKVSALDYENVIIKTQDNDELECDWYNRNQTSCVIMSHGFEGSSKQHYILGLARKFLEQNIDVIAWNYRSCGQNMCRSNKLYHSGCYPDLAEVINQVALPNYKKIFLVGFSAGGNVTLNYLGKYCNIDPSVKAAAVISTPCHVLSTSQKMSLPMNKFYTEYFFYSLKKKIKYFSSEYVASGMDVSKILKAKSFMELDELFTAPLNNFASSKDFYDSVSSLYTIEQIKHPVLFLSSKDDPLMGEESFPELNKSCVSYHYSETGGHMGFLTSLTEMNPTYENTVVDYIKNYSC
jgi:predicted alpha/beta-fold hydrolase